MKYEQGFDGEWFPIPKKGERLACCDCGLVHDVKASKRKGRIGLRYWRNQRATAAIRRGMRLTKR